MSDSGGRLNRLWLDRRGPGPRAQTVGYQCAHGSGTGQSRLSIGQAGRNQASVNGCGYQGAQQGCLQNAWRGYRLGGKGFAGGFGRGTLGPWGENIVKEFVREAVDESLKLESALSGCGHTQRMAVSARAKFEATVEGSREKFSVFFGLRPASQKPSTRYPVTAVSRATPAAVPKGRSGQTSQSTTLLCRCCAGSGRTVLLCAVIEVIWILSRAIGILLAAFAGKRTEIPLNGKCQSHPEQAAATFLPTAN